MNEQTNFETIEIGTKETSRSRLEPKKVKIVRCRVEHIDKAKSNKVIFEVKHPDREELISISSVSTLVDKQVITTGTWINLDEDELIVKTSSLANMLRFLGASNLNESIGKEINTELDANGYLCFKAY